jgi:hypothetical protein
MPGKLRIFISSTMEDLENERAMIVQRLNSMNFEPVNAEGLLPNGATSWDRISEELDSWHTGEGPWIRAAAGRQGDCFGSQRLRTAAKPRFAPAKAARTSRSARRAGSG